MRKFFFILVHVVAPLIFFTHTTENPFSIQIALLQGGILLWVMLELWRPMDNNQTRLDRPLLIFALWCALSWAMGYFSHDKVFRSAMISEGIRTHLFLWTCMGGAFFLARHWHEPSWDVIPLVVAGVSAAYGLLQYVGMDPFWGSQVQQFGGRCMATYGNPNFLSSVMVLFLPSALQRSWSARSPISSVGWGALGLLYVGALLSTLTRSSWGGAMVAVGIFIFLKGPFRPYRVRLGWWIAVAFVMVVWWPTSTSAGNPLHRMVDLWNGIWGGGIYGPWHQRVLIWRSAIDMWCWRPWTGVGWGLFELFYPFHQGRFLHIDVLLPFRTHANNAHQLILEIGSQAGWVGVCLVIWIVARILKAQFRISHGKKSDVGDTAALFSGLVGMAADNAFGNVSLFFSVPGFLFFWVLGRWALRAAPHRGPIPLPQWARPALAGAMGLVGIIGVARCFRGFLGEMAYFRAVQPSAWNDSQGAEEELKKASRLKPWDVQIHFALGNIYLERLRTARARGFDLEIRRNAQLAIEAYTRALGANAGYDEIFRARAEAYGAIGLPILAQADQRLAKRIFPDNGSPQ